MKRHQLFSLLLLVTSLSLSAQSSFLKRRYTKGFFHEKIAKVKSPEAKDNQAATNKRLRNVASNKPLTENNEEVFETVLVTETFVQTDTLSDALVLKETATSCSKTELKKEKAITAKSPRKKTATLKKVQNPSDEDEMVLTKTRSQHTAASIGMNSTKSKMVFKASHSAGDESLWEYLFGDIWSVLLVVFIALAVLTLVAYAVVVFELLALFLSPVALISLLSVILIGVGLYFLISNYSEKHDGKGQKFLDVLVVIGKALSAILIAVFSFFAFLAGL